MLANQADALNSQIVQHLMGCHFVSEAFAVAMYRELSKDHPIRQLLTPHFDGLLEINTAGVAQLINNGGIVSNIAGFGFSGLEEFVRLGYRHWNFEDADFVRDLQVGSRHLNDLTSLLHISAWWNGHR